MNKLLLLVFTLSFGLNSLASTVYEQCYRKDGADSPLMDRVMTFGSVDFRLTADSQAEIDDHKIWSTWFSNGQLTDFEGVSVGNLATEKLVTSDANGTEIKILFRTSNPNNMELAEWFKKNMHNEFEPSEVDVEITFICQDKN